MRRIAIVGVLFCTLVGAGSASSLAATGPTGPVYPPPGGVTLGSSGSSDTAGGLTWTYSSFNQTGWTHMLYGISEDPQLAMNAPAGETDCSSCAAGETMSFSSSDSDLLNGKLVWTGSTTINVNGGDVTGVPTRMTALISDSNGPVTLHTPASFELSPSLDEVGGFVLVDTELPGGYQTNILFEAFYNGSWQPAQDLFDSLATDSTKEVEVNVNGGFWYVNPALELSDSSLSFGTQGLSTTSSDQQVKITNSGNDDLKNLALSITGANTSDFAIHSTTCGTSLSAGSNCTANINFTPSDTGSRSASLEIDSNASTSPDSVSLDGNGSNAQAIVSLAPNPVAFGSQPVSITSAPQTVVLTNTGGIDLHVSGIAIAGVNKTAFKKGTQSCTQHAIAPGDTCSVLVRFAPGSAGFKTGSLVFTDDGAGSPQSVALNGTGTVWADVGIDVDDSPSPVASGGTLTWTMFVSNDGPSQANNVVVTDVLPGNVRFSSVSTSGGTCTHPRIGAGGTVTCKIAHMAKGTAVEINVSVTVKAASGGQVANTVAASAATPDLYASDNTASITTDVS